MWAHQNGLNHHPLLPKSSYLSSPLKNHGDMVSTRQNGGTGDLGGGILLRGPPPPSASRPMPLPLPRPSGNGRLFGETGSFTTGPRNLHNRHAYRRDANGNRIDYLGRSTLPNEVHELIEKYFVSRHDLEKDYIEGPAIRLLEEISTEEAIAAIHEFVERYSVAKHKIKKSRPGYFRGVCQKYWKQNRDHFKAKLLEEARQEEADNGGLTGVEVGHLSDLVTQAVSQLFTPASGLSTKIIDESVEKRLMSLRPTQAIEALYEFCSAVMYRQDRIRNINAYLMNIIKRHVQKAQAAHQSQVHSAMRNGHMGGGGGPRPSRPGVVPPPIRSQPYGTHLSGGGVGGGGGGGGLVPPPPYGHLNGHLRGGGTGPIPGPPNGPGVTAGAGGLLPPPPPSSGGVGTTPTGPGPLGSNSIIGSTPNLTRGVDGLVGSGSVTGYPSMFAAHTPAHHVGLYGINHSHHPPSEPAPQSHSLWSGTSWANTSGQQTHTTGHQGAPPPFQPMASYNSALTSQLSVPSIPNGLLDGHVQPSSSPNHPHYPISVLHSGLPGVGFGMTDIMGSVSNSLGINSPKVNPLHFRGPSTNGPSTTTAATATTTGPATTMTTATATATATATPTTAVTGGLLGPPSSMTEKMIRPNPAMNSAGIGGSNSSTENMNRPALNQVRPSYVDPDPSASPRDDVRTENVDPPQLNLSRRICISLESGSTIDKQSSLSFAVGNPHGSSTSSTATLPTVNAHPLTDSKGSLNDTNASNGGGGGGSNTNNPSVIGNGGHPSSRAVHVEWDLNDDAKASQDAVEANLASDSKDDSSNQNEKSAASQKDVKKVENQGNYLVDDEGFHLCDTYDAGTNEETTDNETNGLIELDHPLHESTESDSDSAENNHDRSGGGGIRNHHPSLQYAQTNPNPRYLRTHPHLGRHGNGGGPGRHGGGDDGRVPRKLTRGSHISADGHYDRNVYDYQRQFTMSKDSAAKDHLKREMNHPAVSFNPYTVPTVQVVHHLVHHMPTREMEQKMEDWDSIDAAMNGGRPNGMTDLSSQHQSLVPGSGGGGGRRNSSLGNHRESSSSPPLRLSHFKSDLPPRLRANANGGSAGDASGAAEGPSYKHKRPSLTNTLSAPLRRSSRTAHNHPITFTDVHSNPCTCGARHNGGAPLAPPGMTRGGNPSSTRPALHGSSSATNGGNAHQSVETSASPSGPPVVVAPRKPLPNLRECVVPSNGRGTFAGRVYVRPDSKRVPPSRPSTQPGVTTRHSHSRGSPNLANPSHVRSIANEKNVLLKQAQPTTTQLVHPGQPMLAQPPLYQVPVGMPVPLPVHVPMQMSGVPIQQRNFYGGHFIHPTQSGIPAQSLISSSTRPPMIPAQVLPPSSASSHYLTTPPHTQHHPMYLGIQMQAPPPTSVSSQSNQAAMAASLKTASMTPPIIQGNPFGLVGGPATPGSTLFFGGAANSVTSINSATMAIPSPSGLNLLSVPINTAFPMPVASSSHLGVPPLSSIPLHVSPRSLPSQPKQSTDLNN